MKFIGFGHRRQMGKDTVAHALAEEIRRVYGIEVVKQSFADPLYEICHKLYGWDGFETKEFYDAYPKQKTVILPTIKKSPRTILIEMGTPAVREVVWEPTWVQYLLNSHDPASKRIVIVTDVRFPNELEAIRSRGVAIRVVRNGIETFNDVADSALEGEFFEGEYDNNKPLDRIGPDILKFVEEVVGKSLPEWIP